MWLFSSLAVLLGCRDPEPSDPPVYTLAVMNSLPDDFQGELPPISMALEQISAAGGVAGGSLEVEYVDLEPGADPVELAESILEGDALGVIGPGESDDLMEVAHTFILAQTPLVSYTSTAGEVLRAFGGSSTIWRTKESDIAQVELMLQFAADEGANSVALVTPVAGVGETFFNWFGFFATQQGFGAEDVTISIFEPGEGQDATRCPDAVGTALDASPDILFAAASSPMDYSCFADAYARSGARVVLLDTGFDTRTLQLGPGGEGIEGFASAPEPGNGFDEAYQDYAGESYTPPHAAGAYDAVLLFAYALAYTGGEKGADLGEAIRAVVDGEGVSVSWDAEGIGEAMKAIREGALPDVAGATGPLDFEPDLYVDLEHSTFQHWQARPGGQIELGQPYTTGTGGLLDGAEEIDLETLPAPPGPLPGTAPTSGR